MSFRSISTAVCEIRQREMQSDFQVRWRTTTGPATCFHVLAPSCVSTRAQRPNVTVPGVDWGRLNLNIPHEPAKGIGFGMVWEKEQSYLRLGLSCQ